MFWNSCQFNVLTHLRSENVSGGCTGKMPPLLMPLSRPNGYHNWRILLAKSRITDVLDDLLHPPFRATVQGNFPPSFLTSPSSVLTSRETPRRTRRPGRRA